MSFTKPTEWADGPEPFTYRHPSGLFLRGVSTIEECRYFNALAVRDTYGILHLSFGRDFKDLDNRHSGDLVSMASELAKNTGATALPIVSDETIVSGGHSNSTEGAASFNYGQINMFGRRHGYVSYGDGAQALFTFPHGCIAGAGGLGDDGQNSFQYAGSSTRSVNLGAVGVAPFYLNATNEEMMQLFVNYIISEEGDPEGALSDAYNTMVNFLNTELVGWKDEQAYVLLTHCHWHGSSKLVKQYPQAWYVWSSTGARAINQRDYGGRAIVDGSSAYRTVCAISGQNAANTFSVKKGCWHYLPSQYSNNSTNLTPAVFNIDTTSFTGGKFMGANDTIIKVQRDPTAHLQTPPGAILGIPITQIFGPIVSQDVVDTELNWEWSDLVNFLLTRETQDYYPARGTVGGQVATDAQYTASLSASTIGDSLASILWREEWTHDVDILFFFELLKSICNDDFNRASIDQMTGITALKYEGA
jgi:hypothetical protein